MKKLIVNLIFTGLILIVSVFQLPAQTANSFSTTWSASSITIPTKGIGYNYDVYWEEVGNASNNGTITSNTGDVTINFGANGTYRVDITGSFPRIYINGGSERLKILTIEQWGNIAWKSMSRAFFGCNNLTINASDVPDLSSVVNASHMFFGAWAFNKDISDWDVSNITMMNRMFSGARSFNQDLSSWDVSAVFNMNHMFYDARSFDQDLSGWDITSATNITNMFKGAIGLSDVNYSALIEGWSSQNVNTGLNLGSVPAKYYRYAADAHASLTGSTANGGYGWSIADEGGNNAFIITTNGKTSFVIKTWSASAYNYDVYWEEIGNIGNNGTLTGNTGELTIDFGTHSNYRMYITGEYFHPNFYYYGTECTLEQWGDIKWQSMKRAFSKSRVAIAAKDIPDLSNVTNMLEMFDNVKTITSDISKWDVSNVTNMSFMFNGATSFNQDISSWDVSNVTNMSTMFAETTSFNRDISKWNVSKVTNMSFMFAGSRYNRNLSTWNVSNVKNMANMFYRNKKFQQPLNSWNVSGVTQMSGMFYLSNYNQNISGWDVSGVTNMGGMFQYNTKFNQNISGWNVSNVTYMVSMFYGAKAFNRDISGWDVSSVAHMGSMFKDAIAFNQDISGWDFTGISTVKGFQSILHNAAAFSDANYSALIESWDSQTILTGMKVNTVPAKYYSTVASSHASLTNTIANGGKGWTISDEGPATGYKLTYLAGSNATLDGDTIQYVASGADGAPVTVVPDAGYAFSSWSDGNTDNPRTETNVTSDTTVTASVTTTTLTARTSAAESRIAGEEPVPGSTKMLLYPNPAADRLHIAMGSTTSASAFYLFDVNGRLVNEHAGEELSTGAGSYQLDLQRLGNGLYILKILDTEGNTYQRQLVIKR